ncbi:MAG: hypothetical protein H0Z32_05065 [Bacillaceae bacterium]|nr:hypothetical protein [Bacillaceae bacterium]
MIIFEFPIGHLPYLHRTVLGETCVHQLSNKGVSSFKFLKATEIVNTGMMTLEEGMTTSIYSNGYLKFTRGINAKNIRAKGNIQAVSIQADHIELSISGICHIRSLLGNFINVHAERKTLSLKRQLECSEIIGEEILVHSTFANYIKGTSVKIGPACIVEELVYSDTWTIHPTAKVEKVIKIQ